MASYLFFLFASFIVNLLCIIPFIDLLYKLKFQRVKQATRDMFNEKTPIFDKFHADKAGRPVGGGLLIVITTLSLFILISILEFAVGQKMNSNYESVLNEVKILLFTFVSFSFLGLYDDLKKIFFWKKDYFFGLRFRHKFIIQIILALIISCWIFFDLKIHIINIPFFGVYDLSYFYILFSTFVIVAFANAINITDGLDGLATGVLMIALMAFWVISRSIVDTPLSTFIAIWLGGLIAFLYFNIFPARIFLGDTGALSFGATFGVIGLLLGKPLSLPIIGGVFVVEIASSFIQILSKKFGKKRFFPVAPFHLLLQLMGWEEPKIVMRAWIFAIMFAILGLMIAFMK
jgi:phospho-N-acetylmuramoyl-pentapeptide-transferase